jgi:hypothetical protein
MSRQGSTWWRCTRCKVKLFAPRKGIGKRICTCLARGSFVLLDGLTPSRQLSLLERSRKEVG